MKMRLHQFIGLLIMLFVISCTETNEATLAELTTIEITGITATSAQSGGTIVTDGGASVTARGVCWSTNPSPTIDDNKTIDGSGAGTYFSLLTGLTPNTSYFVRAYATTSNGTSYGVSFSFTTTDGSISISTNEILNIGLTEVTAGGNILSDGGAPVTSRGVCWSKNLSPTINDNKSNEGSGVGQFISVISGLEKNTTYYVRAYATNLTGTTYGDSRMFMTMDGVIVISTTEITNIDMNTATSGGNIISSGGDEVTSRGVCWSLNANPSVADNKTNEGTGSGNFVSTITNLLPGTTYHVRAYASNSTGTYYGNNLILTTLSPVFTQGGGVTDIDGNTYPSVILGTQEWTTENLRTTKYSNGETILNIANPPSAWENQQAIGAWAYYNNDIQYNSTFGKLYNWFAVADLRNVCPTGWHVPTESEFTTLINFLGGNEVAGDKMKSKTGWLDNGNGNNTSGLTILPAGFRDFLGNFNDRGETTVFWTSTPHACCNGARNSSLRFNTPVVSQLWSNKKHGLSVRCIKD
jgi:uncharacterized protein (TIGR02145 family)